MGQRLREHLGQNQLAVRLVASSVGNLRSVLGLARINRARLDTGVRENIGKNKRCFQVFPGYVRFEVNHGVFFVGSCWAFIWEEAPNDFHAKHIWFPYRKLPFKSNDRRINMLVISLHQMVISRVEATSGAIETLRFAWEKHCCVETHGGGNLSGETWMNGW